MAIRPAATETTSRKGMQSVQMSRSRAEGPYEELKVLFESLMGKGGEGGEETGEIDLDWDELWSSFMGEGGEGGEQENVQGSQFPTMFGAPIRSGAQNAQGGRPTIYW